MKKLFLLTCAMLATILSFAQETKKVAILETVDREGKVSYANKLILRSNLAKAITNTPGYEAYDRTDMDAILGEQNFQRTGMVSDEQIKRLGEMTGAKYVLVAEAAVVDEYNMYITAKLLDVETARTEMTDNQMMATNPKDIQRGCQLLAANLFQPAEAKKYQKAFSYDERTERHAKKETEATYSAYSTGQIVKISNNEYRLDGSVLDKKAYEEFIYNCPEAWRRYKGGKNAIIAGWVLFGVGGFLITMSPFAGLATGIPGGWALAAGVTTFSCGYAFKGNAYKTYNKKCVSQPVSLNVTGGQNGLGLALQF